MEKIKQYLINCDLERSTITEKMYYEKQIINQSQSTKEIINAEQNLLRLEGKLESYNIIIKDLMELSEIDNIKDNSNLNNLEKNIKDFLKSPNKNKKLKDIDICKTLLIIIKKIK